MYRNNFDSTGECAVMGNSAEDLFYKILKNKGEVKKATVKENKAHIDFFLTTGDKTITFDTKARKKANRKDSGVSDEWIWLEFKGVYGGLGWMLSEKTDFIAFERENDFIVVDRKLLLELALKICDLGSIVRNSSDAHYKGYNRYNRQDLISLIKMEDILSIKHEIWGKL